MGVGRRQPAPRRWCGRPADAAHDADAPQGQSGLITGWGDGQRGNRPAASPKTGSNPRVEILVTAGDGKLLHHGHIRRGPPPRKGLHRRARRHPCRAPGCRKPAKHLRQRPPSGVVHATDPTHRGHVDNSCRRHHRDSHEAAFTSTPSRTAPTLWEAPNGCSSVRHTTPHLTTEVNNGRSAQLPPSPFNQDVPPDEDDRTFHIPTVHGAT